LKPSATLNDRNDQKRNQMQEGGIHKGKSVHVLTIVGTLFPVGRSSRNELEKSESNARSGGDIQEHQTFPPYNFVVEYLLVSSTVQVGGDD